MKQSRVEIDELLLYVRARLKRHTKAHAPLQVSAYSGKGLKPLNIGRFATGYIEVIKLILTLIIMVTHETAPIVYDKVSAISKG